MESYEGIKIRLVPISENGLDFICDIESDKSLWYFEEGVEQNQEVLRNRFLNRIHSDSEYDFLIIDEFNQKIGVANIWRTSEFRRIWEIEYAILQLYQKKGYGKEAVTLLLKYAFEELGAHKVVAMCHADNIASSRILMHGGFRQEAIFKEELLWNNTWTDQLFFSILDWEYKNKRQ